MRFSIVIVAYRAEDFLRRCMASIGTSSIEDFEVIVVDNSPEPFKFGPIVRVFHDGVNHGFAEGCNIGARMAQGEILIFLNPDTSVYGDWADRLAKYLEEPSVGAVGPLSDFVAGYQRVQPFLDGDDTMPPVTLPEALSKALAVKNHNQAAEVKCLIGFCLAMRAEVFKEIGGMDSDLFLGNDDLDLSWRLGVEGYRLLVATDVFVHHAGHKSMFTRPRQEIKALLQESERILHDKLLDYYRGTPPSAVELWGLDFFHTGKPRRQTISVVIIARQEHKNLAELVPTLKWADQVVIVDTAKEGEESILQAGRAEIHQFPWVEDFAAARNFAKSKATGDWLLWLDCDDRIPEESAAFIREGLDNPTQRMMNRRSYFLLKLVNIVNGEPAEGLMQPRILPNWPEITWESPVHETAMPSIQKLELEPILMADITIHHHGYATEEQRLAKANRNMAILRTMKDTPQKIFDMATAYASCGQWLEGYGLFRLCLDRWEPHLALGFAGHIRYMVGAALFNMGVFDQAEEWFMRSPKRDALFMRGRCREEMHLKGWEDLFRLYLEAPPTADTWSDHSCTMVPEARKKLEGQVIVQACEAVERFVFG